ncbi:MAG: histidine phosphotransferase family protein [Pseudomonadota bacterium]
MTHQDRITTLVGSRICHDLINPLGAISNGVELLTMTPGQAGPEIALISESVQHANARVRFFRVAFGDARKGQMIPAEDITGILSAIEAGGRHVIDWQADGSLPRNQVRIVFLLIQCLETALPYGGDVQISRDADTWVMVGKGPRMADIDHLWDIISRGDDVDNLPAAQVQFALVSLLQDEIGYDTHIHSAGDGVTIRLSPRSAQ